MADTDMKQSLDTLIKRDKKLGKPTDGNQGRRGGALRGRGRGGANQVPRQANNNQINKNQQRNEVKKREESRNMRRGGPSQQRNSEQHHSNSYNQKQNSGSNNKYQGNRKPKMLQVKDQRRESAQNPRQRVAKQTLNTSQSSNGQRNSYSQNNQSNQRNLPKGPVQANHQRPAKTLTMVKGTLSQRKIKIKNIDPRAVSTPDLQKLFAKSGPLISATFDTNEFGQYLGTATIIYSTGSAAARSIKDYNLAQIDKRTMRVEYAQATGTIAQSGSSSSTSIKVTKPTITHVATGRGRGGSTQANQNQRTQNTGIRRTDARIQKSGRGRTLNVTGASSRRGRPQGNKQ